jgi:hypothetical protein
VDKLNQTVSDLSVAYPSMEVKLKDTRPDVMPNDQIVTTTITYEYNGIEQGATFVTNENTGRTLSGGGFGWEDELSVYEIGGSESKDNPIGASSLGRLSRIQRAQDEGAASANGFTGVVGGVLTADEINKSLKENTSTITGEEYLKGKNEEEAKIKAENEIMVGIVISGNLR